MQNYDKLKNWHAQQYESISFIALIMHLYFHVMACQAFRLNYKNQKY